MPDITMCAGNGCPIKMDCYRHIAKPSSQNQSYFAEIPYEEGKCEVFWPAYDRDVRINEVHDEQGNLTKLEAYDVKSGDHVLDGHWDPTDDQTPENREHFREWFNAMLRNKSVRPIN